MMILRLKDLSIALSGKEILRDIDGEFQAGEMIGILGQNGAGKTTLIRAIAGLVKYQKGQVQLLSKGETFGREAIAYLPQMSASTGGLTVFEAVLLGLRNHLGWRVSNAQIQQVEAVLQKLEIGSLAQRRLDQLSGGQRQLVYLAQAFVSEPKVLLLDEPTSALDLRHQLVVMKAVQRYCRETGAIVMYVIHDLTLAARFSDRVMMLHEGAVQRLDVPAQVLTSAIIDPIYGISTLVERNCLDFVSVTPIEPLN